MARYIFYESICDRGNCNNSDRPLPLGTLKKKVKERAHTLLGHATDAGIIDGSKNPWRPLPFHFVRLTFETKKYTLN